MPMVGVRQYEGVRPPPLSLSPTEQVVWHVALNGKVIGGQQTQARLPDGMQRIWSHCTCAWYRLVGHAQTVCNLMALLRHSG